MMSRRKRHFVGRGVKMPMSACLDCGKELNGATAVDHRGAPASGSISICVYCGHLMAFGDDLRLRPLTDAEMIGIAGDPSVLAVQRARRDAVLKNLTSKKGGAP
jgi:hypothetical protein